MPCDDDQPSEDGEFFAIPAKKDTGDEEEDELYIYDA